MAALAKEPEGAAAAYVKLRRRLVDYFISKNVAAFEADELADEALDRTARRAVVEEMRSAVAFAVSVARLVSMESFKSGRYRERQRDKWSPDESHVDDPRLPKVIAAVKNSDDAVLLDYFTDGNRIRLRKALAERLGVPQSRLRTHIHRKILKLRRKLGTE